MRELLEVLLGEEGRRKLRLRQTPIEELFRLYDGELVCRHRSERGLKEARRVLGHFREFLGPFPPTSELAKAFLSKFACHKVTTLYRYTAIIKGFMAWYGEKLDVKVRVPRMLPQYVEEDEVEALRAAISNKRTHKRTIGRDLLLVDVADNTGLRRGELANLEVRDLHLDQGILVVKKGKGGKDGIIPLTKSMAARLQAFVAGMAPEEKVFGLKPSSISGKVKRFSQKAGVDIHPHSLRHHFATKLAERGANIRAVQELLRHESLNNTQIYLSLTGRGLREAIDLLEQPSPPQEDNKVPSASSLVISPSLGVEPRPLMSWEIVEQRKRAEELLRRMSY